MNDLITYIIAGALVAISAMIAEQAQAQFSDDPNTYATGGVNYNSSAPRFTYSGYDQFPFNDPMDAIQFGCAVRSQHPSENCYDVRFDFRYTAGSAFQFYYEMDITLTANDENITGQGAVDVTGLSQEQFDHACIANGDAGDDADGYGLCDWHPDYVDDIPDCGDTQIYWNASQMCVPQSCGTGFRMLDGTCTNPCETAPYYKSYSCSLSYDNYLTCPPGPTRCLASPILASACEDDSCNEFYTVGVTPGCIYDFDGSYEDVEYYHAQFDQTESVRIYTGILDPDQPHCSGEDALDDACLIFATGGECVMRQSELDDLNDLVESQANDGLDGGEDPPTDSNYTNTSYWNCDISGAGYDAARCATFNGEEYDSGFTGGDPSNYPGSCSEITYGGNAAICNSVIARCDTDYTHGFDAAQCASNGGTEWSSGGQYADGQPTEVPDFDIDEFQPGGSLSSCDGTNDGQCYCAPGGMSPGGASDTWGNLCSAFDTSGDGNQNGEGGEGEGSGSGGGSGEGEGEGEEGNGECDPAVEDCTCVGIDAGPECYPDGSGGFYDPKYPEGLSGMLADKAGTSPELNGLQSWLDNTTLVLAEAPACPSWQMTLPVVGVDITVEPYCMVWDWIRMIMIATSSFAAFGIVRNAL